MPKAFGGGILIKVQNFPKCARMCHFSDFKHFGKFWTSIKIPLPTDFGISPSIACVKKIMTHAQKSKTC